MSIGGYSFKLVWDETEVTDPTMKDVIGKGFAEMLEETTPSDPEPDQTHGV